MPPVRSARRGRSGTECRPVQRVQRPDVCVVPCVVCPGICPPWFWRGLPCCRCRVAVPGALGCRGYRWGI
nr:MAG TPA: hypothetical protein [Caudoviricetes sp.]